MDEEEVVDIKVEDEMGIFVKEEETFIEGTSYYNNYDEYKSKYDDLLEESYPALSGKELLIYTTKVDDIWKPYFDIETKNILDRLERGSKPVFTGHLQRKKKRKYMIKFRRFVQNLQKYNETVAHINCNIVDLEENSKHKKQQIIQTITVDDTDSETTSTHEDDQVEAFTPMYNDYSNINIKSLVPESPKSNHYMIAIHTLELRNNKKPSCSSSLKKDSSNFYDVYIMSKEGIPKEFYQFDHHQVLNITDPINIVNININNCCWYTREEKIKQRLPDICAKYIAFLRTPHTCTPEKCKCCCRRKYKPQTKAWHEKGMTYKPEDGKPIGDKRDYFKNRWHQRLLQKSAPQNKYSINAALLNRPERLIHKTQTEKNCHRDTYLNLKVGESQKLNYYIVKNGLINTMVTIDSHNESHVKNCTNMIGDQQYVNQYICCLDKYNKYILKLVKLSESSIAKCIFNIPEISLHRCDNCENVETLIYPPANRIAIKISVPKYPKHTINYSNKNARSCSNVIYDQNTESTFLNISDKLNEQKKLCNTVVNTENNFINLDIADLQLIVAPGGNVKIQTKSNPEKISTENLKILREILRYANIKLASVHLNINQLTQTMYIHNVFTKTCAKTPLRQNIETTPAAVTQKLSNTIKETFVNSKKTSDSDIKNREPDTSNSIKNISIGNFQSQCNLNSDERRKDNIYQSFTNVSAQKRLQYMHSYGVITTTGNDLWTSVKQLKYDKRILIPITHNTENMKRKLTDKSTSPPPKQQRKADNKSVASVSSTSGLILRNTLMAPSVQRARADSLKVTNANVTTLPSNVTVIPIGQLHADIVQNLYKQYAVLEPTQQTQIPNPMNLTESALLLPTSPLAPYTTSTLIPVFIPPTGVVTPMTDDNVSSTSDKEEDCILGV